MPLALFVSKILGFSAFTVDSSFLVSDVRLGISVFGMMVVEFYIYFGIIHLLCALYDSCIASNSCSAVRILLVRVFLRFSSLIVWGYFRKF